MASTKRERRKFGGRARPLMDEPEVIHDARGLFDENAGSYKKWWERNDHGRSINVGFKNGAPVIAKTGVELKAPSNVAQAFSKFFNLRPDDDDPIAILKALREAEEAADKVVGDFDRAIKQYRQKAKGETTAPRQALLAAADAAEQEQRKARAVRDSIRAQRASLQNEVDRVDDDLKAFDKLGLGGTAGYSASLRAAYIRAEPEERKAILQTLDRVNQQVGAAGTKDEQENARKSVMNRIAHAIKLGQNVHAAAGVGGLPPQFAGIEVDKLKSASSVEERLERVKAFQESRAWRSLSPDEQQKLAELRASLKEKYDNIVATEKRAREDAPHVRRLRERKAKLRELRDETDEDSPARTKLDKDLARVDRELESIDAAKAANTLHKRKQTRHWTGRAFDSVRERMDDMRVRALHKDENAWSKRASRAVAPMWEETKESASSTFYSLLNRHRANRIRRSVVDAKKAQRIANSSLWKVYYGVTMWLTPLRVMFLALGFLFVPFGLAHFVSWALFGVFTFALNALYAVAVEGFNLLSGFFILGINFVGNAGSALANWAGQTINGLLNQPYSPYYWSLANVRLQATPLIDPLFFFPERFNTNSWFSVLMDSIGWTSVADVFRTGNERVVGSWFEPIRIAIEQRFVSAVAEGGPVG